MSCLKSPGLDALPKEFYAFAFKYIGKSFVEMLNNSWEEGILAQSQRVGTSVTLSSVTHCSLKWLSSLTTLPIAPAQAAVAPEADDDNTPDDAPPDDSPPDDAPRDDSPSSCPEEAPSSTQPYPLRGAEH